MKKYQLLLLLFFCIKIITAQTPDLVPYLKAGLWGYSDRNKNIVITPKFKTVTLFKEKITPVTLDSSLIFIDVTGKQVGSAYEGFGEFSEGLCQVKKNGLQGYINASGKVIIPIKFKATNLFNEGFAVVREDSLWGVIDKKGAYVIKPVYPSASNKFQGGFLHIQKKERNYLVDSKGKELKLPANAKLLDAFNEGLAVVELFYLKNDPQIKTLTASTNFDTLKLHGFINNKGKIALGPFKEGYKILGAFSNGFCLLQTSSSLFYYVSKENKFSSYFSSARPFSQGYAIGQKGANALIKSYVIDSLFHLTKVATLITDAGKFSDGLVWIKQVYGIKFGYMNTKGETVIEFKYDKAGDFTNGIAIVELNKVTFCIDKKGTQFRE